jgi:hypothetical protein
MPEPQSSRTRGRMSVPPTCHVPGLEVTYDLFSDPGSDSAEGSTYRGVASGRVTLEVNEDRQRLYLFCPPQRRRGAGRSPIGVASHEEDVAFIKKMDVDAEFQRRSIASALYETFRAAYPRILVGMVSGPRMVRSGGLATALPAASTRGASELTASSAFRRLVQPWGSGARDFTSGASDRASGGILGPRNSAHNSGYSACSRPAETH